MKGQNFATEDRLDPGAFNRALWRGLGTGPEPLVRDARDLSDGRRDHIKHQASGLRSFTGLRSKADIRAYGTSSLIGSIVFTVP